MNVRVRLRLLGEPWIFCILYRIFFANVNIKINIHWYYQKIIKHTNILNYTYLIGVFKPKTETHNWANRKIETISIFRGTTFMSESDHCNNWSIDRVDRQSRRFFCPMAIFSFQSEQRAITEIVSSKTCVCQTRNKNTKRCRPTVENVWVINTY